MSCQSQPAVEAPLTLTLSQRERGRNGHRAFTLLELVLVMMLLCIVAAMCVPSMRAFGQGQRIKACSAHLVSLAQYARAQAVTRGIAYRLNFDTTGGTFWLTSEQNGAFQSLGEDFGRTFAAPDGVTFEWIGGAVERGAIPYMEFLPTGRTTEAAGVRLTDAAGFQTDVACYSPAEPVRARNLSDWNIR